MNLPPPPRTCTVVAALMVAAGVVNARIAENEALARAQAFLAPAVNSGKMLAKSVDNLQLVSEADACYVFSPGVGKGYVIVSSSDVTSAPVLGYSDKGDFTDIAPALAEYLSEYAESPTSDWLYAAIKPVAPLLDKIAWNQDYPYNLHCPEVDDGEGGKVNAVAGCVAISVAQVMAYHKYPSDYDWANILPDYSNVESSEEQKAAVARLVSDVGKAVGMSYGLSSSGAASADIKGALTDDFGYAGTMVYHTGTEGSSLGMSYYSIWDIAPSAYNAIIYEELQVGRPVILDGVSKSGSGHSFVCDGNDADGFLHINWGWGGVSNGYFIPAVLTPEWQGYGGSTSGYNRGKGILYGIQPPSPDATIGIYSKFGDFVPETDGSGFTMVLYRRSNYNWVRDRINYGINWGLRITDTKGNHVKYVVATGTDSGKLEAYSIGDGEYRIYPVWRESASAPWRHFWPKPGTHPFALMSVKDGVRSCAVVDVPAEPLCSAEILEKPGILSIDTDEKVVFRMINNGAETHYPNTYVRLINVNSGDVAAEMALDGNFSLSYGQSSLYWFSPDMLFDKNTVVSDGENYRLDIVSDDKVVVSSEPILMRSRSFPATRIKDENLRKLLKEYDVNRDGVFNDYDLMNAPRYIDMSNSGIRSLEGIEGFFKLVTIGAEGNSITEIDIDGMPELSVVNVYENPDLKRISLKNVPDMERVSAYKCSLEELVLPDEIEDFTLDVAGNGLTNLSLGNIGRLYLDCSNNQLESLIIPESTKLASLDCSDNRLAVLELPTDRTELKSVICDNNMIVSLDVSGSPKLTRLWCENNRIEDIDIAGCTGLTELRCRENRIRALNVDACKELRTLSVSDNIIEHLDLSALKKLEHVDANDNRLFFFNPVGTKCNFVGNECAARFTGDGIDLRPYMEKGLDLSKIEASYYCRIDGDRLELLDSRRRSAQYIYAGEYFMVGDIDSEVSLSTDEICLPEIGSTAKLTVYDRGSVCGGLDMDFETIEVVSSEMLTELRPTGPNTGEYDYVGTEYTLRRLAPGDVDIHAVIYGRDPLICKVVSFSGIGEPEADGYDVEPVEYYDLHGRRIASPLHGSVTIVKMSDGSVRKVIR